MTNPLTGFEYCFTSTTAYAEGINLIIEAGIDIQTVDVDRITGERSFLVTDKPGQDIDAQLMLLTAVPAEYKYIDKIKADLAEAQDTITAIAEQAAKDTSNLAGEIDELLTKLGHAEDTEEINAQTLIEYRRSNADLQRRIGVLIADGEESAAEAMQYSREAHERQQELYRLKAVLCDIMTTPSIIELEKGQIQSVWIVPGAQVQIVDCDTPTATGVHKYILQGAAVALF